MGSLTFIILTPSTYPTCVVVRRNFLSRFVSRPVDFLTLSDSLLYSES